MKKYVFLLVTMFAMSLIGQVKLTSALHESEDNGIWKNGTKEIFLYDANNKLSSKNVQFWHEDTNTWGYSELFTYSYNSNNVLIEEKTKVWDKILNSYVNNYKENYTYNSNNQLVEFSFYFWQDDNWVNVGKFTFSYGSDGKKIGKIFYNWNTNEWLLVNRIIISYGSNGKVSSLEEESNYDGNWAKSTLRTYTYNADDKVVVEAYKSWADNVYKDFYKYEFMYDANGNLVNKKFFYNNNGVFELNSNETNTFDTNLLMASFTHPFIDASRLDYEFIEFPYINKIKKVTYSNQRVTYNYGEETANVKGFNSLNFTVYPNPTNSVLIINDGNFTLKNVEVYNLLGKKLLTTTKNELNLKGLVNGVYFIKIEDIKGNFATKRIIKN